MGLIDKLIEPLCKVNPLPQQNQICIGHAEVELDDNVSSYIT